MTELSEIPFTIFNTETKKQERVETKEGKTLSFYACGPTVYDYAHIGNFRTFVAEDLLRKALIFFGMKVKYVMNLTDVDDKTIKGAIKANISLDDFTEKYKKAFFDDLATLNIQQADQYPEATKFIPQMISMIETLIEKKIAYQGADGSIYYAISKFPRYGCLSHLKLDDLQINASERLSSDEYTKEHASDFVLWKKYDPTRDGNIFWESPFGQGRPGWHLECSVMSQSLLGETVDIHAGGIDLIFPHHENEIAQSEGATGKTFCNHWMHVEHLLVDHKKMSKSLGNYYTLRDLLSKGYSGKVIRFALLQTHYRVSFNFTMQVLEAAKLSCQRISDFIIRVEEEQEKLAKDKKEIQSELHGYLQNKIKEFASCLADDLNISEALAVLFDLIRHVNALLDKGSISAQDISDILDFMKKVDSVLGIMDFQKVEIPSDIQQLVDARIQARKDKNWKRSDEIRDEIIKRGYLIEDTQGGFRVKKK